MKIRYDRVYTFLFLNAGDEVYLNLYKNYRISGINGQKFTRQRVNSFKIVRRVSPLAYEFKLPSNMKIYPVISVTYLKPIPHGKDPYNRPRNDYVSPIQEGAVDPNSE